ncbi:MAG: 2-phospho-L-lactate transferase [Hyphomicrobiaceae bacterium]
MSRSRTKRVVALSGGVGGAKLALGLYRVMAPGSLTVIANTADDFDHLGLAISPDIDTLIYTLARIANPQTGWGREDETWNFIEALRAIGGEDWFLIGDKDLAVHVERTRRLRSGERLSSVTMDLVHAFNLECQVLPMADVTVRTRLKTTSGWLAFQEYFVRLNCAPTVRQVVFAGIENAVISSEVRAALSDPDLAAVIICPSNPIISIAPILAVGGLRDLLRETNTPVIAVSPILLGRAVKGPTAKMLKELGIEVSAAAVAERYSDIIDAIVVEPDDADMVASRVTGIDVRPAKTLMETLEDREQLAEIVLGVAAEIRQPRNCSNCAEM